MAVLFLRGSPLSGCTQADLSKQADMKVLNILGTSDSRNEIEIQSETQLALYGT